MSARLLLAVACWSVLLWLCAAQERILIGDLSEIDHDVSGTVYAINDRTLEIEGFNYDGIGPAGVYWVDRGSVATREGVIAPTAGTCEIITSLPEFRDETVRIELPDNLTLSDVGHFSIWCEAVGTSFGGVDINAGDLSPTPPTAQPQCGRNDAQPTQRILIGPLETIDHDVAGTLYALNERTLQIENFVYDGVGPAAVYWIDRGNVASSEGLIAPALDSCDLINPLPAFDGQTVRIELPDDLTLSEVGFFSIWCEAVGTSFGGIEIDVNRLDETPAPADAQCGPGGDSAREDIFPVREGYNCESLSSSYQVRWQLDSANDAVNIELVAALEEDVYMGFGVSGSDEATNMVGSDVAIAFKQGDEYFAIDYHMSSRAFCSEGNGVCPDEERDPENGRDQFKNIEGDSQENVVRISYTRPIAGEDANVDRPIKTDGPTFISWATGPLDTVSRRPTFHGNMRGLAFPEGDVQIDFTRDVQDNCDALEIDTGDSNEQRAEPFERPVFSDVTEFTARIGPSGFERGVTALRGISWGIAWYLSPEGSEGEDVLIPAIGVERGKTYSFKVYGGNSGPGSHPLYITSNARGGYRDLSPADRLTERVYAGINITSQNASGIYDFIPTAAGSLCEFDTSLRETTNVETYEAFYSSLDTSCTQNDTITRDAGELVWTVEDDTPDVVYYQCVTHSLLGFEIRVFDEGQVDEQLLRQVSSGAQEESSRTCMVTVGGDDVSFDSCAEIDASSEYMAYWNIREDEIETLIRVRTGGYAGFGWGYSSMTPGNAAVVYKTGDDSAEIDDYQLSQRNTAGVQPNTNQGLTNTAAFVEGEFVIGRFTRKLSITDLPSIPSEGETNAIWSIGARPESPTSLIQHATEGVATINLSSGSSTSSGSRTSAFFIVHGVFMGLSWLLFAPTAIITMRYFKKYNPVAFQIHRGLNGTVVILVIVAYFMGIARGNRVERAHLIIGSILFSLTVLQGLGGLLRPQKSAPARKPWYFGHAFVGSVASGLGIANVFLGIAVITDRGSNARGWYAVAGVVVAIVVLLHIILSAFPHRFPTYIEGDSESETNLKNAVPDDPIPAGPEDSRI
ncbi:Cytochrome b561/ferric reductase transmembrane [Gracilaria domingensis]|nr:Cytochrome b561/ferric reductase transmembrane [Gracilaria domingensis]